MDKEPIQHAPLINHALHDAVFAVSVIALIVALFIFYRRRHEITGDMREYWRFVCFGLVFYTISEYSDLYTPGLTSSLGGHNYLTEQTLVVALVFLFIAIHRMVGKFSNIPENAGTSTPTP
jgi:hypothetical protein